MTVNKYEIMRVTWFGFSITADLYDDEHRVNIELKFYIQNPRRFNDFRRALRRHQFCGDKVDVNELIAFYERMTGEYSYDDI